MTEIAGIKLKDLKTPIHDAGFLAISDGVYQKHPNILDRLNPQDPRRV